jgi:hypothetical protein
MYKNCEKKQQHSKHILHENTLYNIKKKVDVSERHECPHREYSGGSQMVHPFLIPPVIG